jgi:hypothetical protein
LQFGNALNVANLCANCLGKLQRRRAQRLGKRKNRNREVPKIHLWGLFDHDAGQGGTGMLALQTLQHALGQTMFQMTVQEGPLSG